MLQGSSRKGFKSHGIREPLTTRISGILRAYPDSTQIARELLQNSDDARSTVQWYLLDHRHHAKHARSIDKNSTLKLFHEDLEEYMGPALLAGSDSVFEEKDFISLQNLASSEKKADESKIGQMGIGFNSTYHLSDCPSFISGDQFMVIEPHERIFNGERSEFNEGAVLGNFVEGNQGLQEFPDQLRAFSVLEDIDFTKPYNGTIFRFPLRTPEQAKASLLTKYYRTPQEVLEMLTELKDEALKALLFLKHVQKILIYERKEDQDTPTKLFEIEVVNAAEVGAQRSQLLSDFNSHVQSAGSLNQDSILECSVQPTFRMTHEDGRTTEETWQVTTRIGNIDKTRAAMLEDSCGDVNIADHKLIPWVGIAAPIDPGVKLDMAGLFCFLPIGDIQLPFPVHVNGHFAVEQSRRDIWTNADKKIKVQSSAGIEALWNVHLFSEQIPEAYALFLENIGVGHGGNYDLWPLTCGGGVGRDAIWKDMLSKTLRAALIHDRPVFSCGPDHSGEVTIEPYSKVHIAGRDIDAYPLLKKALHAVVTLAENVPDVVLAELPDAVESLGLAPCILTSALVISILNNTKKQWYQTADAATRVEMVKYCLQDDKSASLVGLPLLPLADGSWVEFSRKQARERFRVSQEMFRVLTVSNKCLVDLDVKGYPFDEIESGCRAASKRSNKSWMYWTTLPPSLAAERIKAAFYDLVYQDEVVLAGRISRTPEQFPSDKWLTAFWNMTHSLSNARDQKSLLSALTGLHLIPLNRGYLAPLSDERSVLYLNSATSKDVSVSRNALQIMDHLLDCQVLQEIPMKSMLPLQGYLIDVSVGPRVLGVLSKVDPSLYQQLSPEDRCCIQQYLTTCLSPRAALDLEQRQVLRYLPVFETYNDAGLAPLNTSPELNSKKWLIAQGYNHSSQPWIPTSVNLLAEDQPMKHHLRHLLEIPFLNKAEYLHLLVSQLEERHESDWDPILSELSLGYYELKKKVDFTPLLRKLAFVQVRTRSTSKDAATPARIKPGSVVDAGLAMFFMDEEAVFPAGIYAQPAFRGPLEELGMTHKFSPVFVGERMSSLFDTSSDEHGPSHKMAAQAFYDRLSSSFSKEFMTRDILSKMSSLPWLYVDSGDLCCPRECRPKEDRCLVGDQMPLSDFSPSNELLRDRMGWMAPPPLNRVLAYFSTLLDQEYTTTNNSSNLEDHDVAPIYKYLAAKVQDRASLIAIKESLSDRPWILVSGRLYSVDRVAFKMEYDLRPHFVQVPSSSLDSLYRSLGVRENIHYRDFESILANLALNNQGDECLSFDDASLVRRLLFALSHEKARKWSPELPVLTKDGYLKRAADVVYDDRSARQAGSDDNLLTYTFLDNGIPKDVAQRLKIAMFSVRTSEESKDVAFQPFFQQEDIVNRIKGILTDYDPSGIFNEYLQNASDAGATKFSAILDTRAYDKTKLLDKEMEKWQGPALVFYNNAKFTEEGFSALCKLGVGNKRDDTSKIGRHGLGFNSAYHFTDVPSVVSGNSLVIFDPHMSNLPKSRDANGNIVAQRGHRYDLRKLSLETLADQLQPYKGIFGCDMESYFEGTIFRIPLRVKGMKRSGKSSFGGEGWTVAQVRNMFASWIEDAKIGMLFLKNIESIELSDGSSPKVSVTKRDHFSNPAMRFMVESIPSNSCQVSILDITSTSTGIGNADSSRWLVYVEDSLPIDAPQQIYSLVQKHHWSTQSGLAIPLGDNRSFKSCRGRLVVHLPTPIETKLPFHLHGGFALTTNRKILAGGTDAGNEMSIWNTYLLENRLPLTAIQAYRQLLRWYFRPATVGGPIDHDLNGAMHLYYKHWPVKAQDTTAAFLRVFFEHTYTSPVFPCRGHPSVLPITAVPGKDVVLKGLSVTMEVESRVFAWLREGGLFIAETPHDLQSYLMREWSRDATHPFRQIDCTLIRRRLREDPDFIPRQMKLISDKRWILEEVFKPLVAGSQEKEPLEGLAVVPLENGEWKPLHSFPVYYIATPEARELIEGRGLLIDSNVIESVHIGKAKDKLVENPHFGIEELPLGVFAAIVLSENPGGILKDKRERLWRYLAKFEDLTPVQDLPIVETTSGAMVTLAKASCGLNISGAHLQEKPLRITTGLLRRLGVEMFDAVKNFDHRHFQNLRVSYTERRVLELVAKNLPLAASPFTISTEEAEFLRNLIRSPGHKDSLLYSLGDLPIWPTYGPQGAPLRPAKGSFYMTDHENLDNLGYHRNILQEINGMTSFDKLGANPILAATLLREHIMPKFESNELRWTGHTKGAYLSLCRSIMTTASRKKTSESITTKQVLQHGRCFLARDGSFQSLSHMFIPHQELTETIFANEQHRFPNDDVYNILMARGFKPEIRGIMSSGVVEECARFVLDEIADGAGVPAQILARAKHLVRHIYTSPGTTNWMDPKWTIVPREFSPEFPYDQHTPALPRYMSFTTLCYPVDRDHLWTQRGFFPQDLIPTAGFKVKYPDIGKYSWRECSQHLEVLVKHIAPTLTSTERHLDFKVALFKIYKSFESRGSESKAVQDSIRTSFRDIMTVPYILNGDDKDPSKADSWVWPHELVFGIDHKIGAHHQAHSSLLKYRSFLVAVGANEMKYIAGQIKLGPRRRTGELEERITTYFETQDNKNGFMDVRFAFESGKSILAHKVVLASMSEEVIRQLTGSWALTARRDPSEPAIDIIQKEHDYTAFWGLLYFLYTDDLISTNGPPTILQTARPSAALQEEDVLSQRVEYLMALQHLADFYRADRLKALIAQELMLPGKVMYSNVFEIRAHAELNQDKDVIKYCTDFIGVKENGSLIKKYIEDEIAAVEAKLVALDKYLGGDGDGEGEEMEAKEALKLELLDLKAHLRELSTKH
ncbi:hypothetical protein BGW39_009706 [Mortierella sp. 14UC]|nr:hypothetical protein BGW39_009706 [Mortierella sp. 14UC]